MHRPHSSRSMGLLKGEAEVISNTLTKSYDLGISDVLQLDIVHISGGVLVNTWSIEEAGK